MSFSSIGLIKPFQEYIVIDRAGAAGGSPSVQVIMEKRLFRSERKKGVWRQSLMGGMDEIIKEFLAESAENLDQLDQDLVSLEKSPDDREVFARIFRTIHTIKGTCGFLAFGKLEEVTHSGETLLSHLRDGLLKLSPEITTTLLAMIDAVRAILSRIEQDGGEGDQDYKSLIADLQRLNQEVDVKKKIGSDPEEAGSRPSPSKINRADDSDKKRAAPQPEKKPVKPKKKAAPRRKAKKPSPANLELSQQAPATPDPTEMESAPDDTGKEPGVEAPAASTLGENSLRVDVGALDRLMNLVGELVLARNQILRQTKNCEDAALVGAAQRLHGVTTELQEAVMKTRMQPIRFIWKKFPRFVRDLAQRFDKQVEITMEGQDTELDKAVIEAIKGSLLHLVRNSVDHGIESPEVRIARGKNPAGTLRLRAHHEGGNVLIEVGDDGGGIDHEAVLERGLSAHLLTPAEAKKMKPAQIEGLLFRPGFSTADKVTNVSGRGVGLDIVLNNIEAIGGSVEIQSEPGLSTSFRLKIPLTLAIIPILLVSTGGRRFAIPQVSVVELLRLDPETDDLGVEDLNGVPVYRLRGLLLPLLYLDRELNLPQSGKKSGRAVNIVVLQGDDRRFGLVVDVVEDSQEIVVKPLGRLLGSLPYAGTTILGNGEVALILDVLRLGLAAGVVSESRTHMASETDSTLLGGDAERTMLLYLLGPNDERMALDFACVDRLEFIPIARIERVGGLPVVQYRNEILQLVFVDETLPERRTDVRRTVETPDLDAVQVVVCSIDGYRIGLVVFRILDILSQSLDVTRPASREGVEACVVIKERVTEVIDLRTLIQLSDPTFFDRAVRLRDKEA
ncbi:MAG: chemotaxis protein CheA [Thermoanaerobaculales bacterium]|nr:chemotaxis protein CheA [Thermoanaerobaculales bacterium]